MKIIPVCAESFGANTYIIVSDSEALVVDPTVSTDAILSAIRAEDAHPIGVILTHGHFDHVLSLDRFRQATGTKAFIHEDDAIMLTDGKKNAFFEFFGKERTFGAAENLLRDGQRIRLGNEEIEVLHTPGHTQGSVCYLCGDALITGDTLFAESFGRCDLWSGSLTLMSSSLRRLRTLDPKLTIYPGHGCPSRLGDALDNVAYLL